LITIDAQTAQNFTIFVSRPARAQRSRTKPNKIIGIYAPAPKRIKHLQRFLLRMEKLIRHARRKNARTEWFGALFA